MDVLLDYIQGSENNYLGTVNDRLSILGAHLETKAFFFGGGGVHLMKRGWLFKKKRKNKNKKYRSSKYFTKIIEFLRKFLLELITKVLFFLFKLAVSFHWAFKLTWALMRNFPRRLAAYWDWALN